MTDDPLAEGYRSALLDALRPLPPAAPLLLSGGVDSGTLLAGLLALGRAPACVSYVLRGFRSPDALVAAAMCDAYGLRLEIVELEPDVDWMADRVRRVADLAALSRPWKQTHVHCTVALAEMLSALPEGPAIVGTGGVVLDTRDVHVAWVAEGEDAAREIRREALLGKADNATWAMKRLGDALARPLLEPLSAEPIASYALAVDYAEMNRPKQKGMALRAFPEFWGHPWYRRNANLQVASGLRDWFAAAAHQAGFRSGIAMIRSWDRE